MKNLEFYGMTFYSNMSLYEIRKILLDYYDKILTDKIRVYSMVYMKSKEICELLEIKFEGYFLAIGELNAKSFSIDIQEKGGFVELSETYNRIHDRKYQIINELEEKGINQYQYDLTGAGYTYLRKLLSEQEFYRTSIHFESSDDNNEIFVVNGASSGLKFIFEMLYRKSGRKVKMLFPVPMFMPIVHASDIFLDTIMYETHENNQFKITQSDVERLISENTQLDAFYLCLLNNPTSISYTSQEIEQILRTLLTYNKNIQIIIDGVYMSGGNINEIHKIFQIIEQKGWLNNIILIDGEGKSKARTGKRSGSIYIKNKENSLILSNIIRNSTGGIGSDIMLETIAVLKEVDKDFSQSLYEEISLRREKFLYYIFNNKNYLNYLEDYSTQPLLKNGMHWQGGLYVFLKLKENVNIKDFILNTGIIGTPGEIFGGNYLNNYIRLSFGYEYY